MSTWKPQKCSHGKMGPAGGCQECWERALSGVAKTSHAGGLGQAARIIEDGAIEAFKAGDDSYARTLREIRDLILAEAKSEEEEEPSQAPPQAAPQEPSPEPNA